MLTPEDISKMKESPPYAAGMKALTKTKEGQSLSLQEFSDTQDLVIVKLAMLVGSRPAPLENATIEDYKTAKKVARIRSCTWLNTKGWRQDLPPLVWTKSSKTLWTFT